MPYKGCTLPTNSALWAVADASTMAEQLHTQQPSHDDTTGKKCYLRDFKQLPNQNSIDIQMQRSKALLVANSKSSTNAHLVRICPEDGRGRYVMFFIITSETITS